MTEARQADAIADLAALCTLLANCQTYQNLSPETRAVLMELRLRIQPYRHEPDAQTKLEASFGPKRREFKKKRWWQLA